MSGDERLRARLAAGSYAAPSGCRIWTRKKTAGYGRICVRIDGKGHNKGVHRVSWELENGPIPEGMKVRHHCDTRLCIEPSHLFLGTQRGNVQDMLAKGRGSDPAEGSCLMPLPTETEIRAHQAKKHAEREAEFAANPPAGSSGFTYDKWSRLTFGDQAYYRHGAADPNYKPSDDILRAMAVALSDTPSPSIVSGYGVWAFDILELLHRRGWKLVRG